MDVVVCFLLIIFILCIFVVMFVFLGLLVHFVGMFILFVFLFALISFNFSGFLVLLLGNITRNEGGDCFLGVFVRVVGFGFPSLLWFFG